jgi:hypothetical protein
MNGFLLFAHPWWVNLLLLVPFAAYYFFRRGLRITNGHLFVAALFSSAMGFLESAVVVYLRAALGNPSPAGIPMLSAQEVFNGLPRQLLAIEVYREAATLVMLVCIALLVAQAARERWAIFLWSFAIWDIVYYVGLRLTIGWPSSLATPDVLFLIPVPWYAAVWFPLLVSALCLIAVLASRKR